jgi:peptide/nickel transport system permease protein
MRQYSPLLEGSHSLRYALTRIVRFVFVFVIVTFVVLVATRIGSIDPVRDLAGGQVSDEVIARVEADYPYLDKPLVVQYVFWLKDMLTGDWGYSYAQNQSVLEMFQQRGPATFFLGFWAITVGLLFAVPIGVYSAYKRDSPLDRTLSVGSFAAISLPPVVIGVGALWLTTRIDFFPAVANYVAPWDSPIEHFQNFFLPSMMLAIGLAAVWSRLLRADMILTLQSDFINLARAKGVSPNRVLWVHALRSSILSLITSVALQMGALVSGAVVAEQFFNLGGIGTRLVTAVQQNDILTIQAITAVVVAIVVFVNLMVDLLYAVVDPRIRQARKLG